MPEINGITINPENAQFISLYPVDKILATGTGTFEIDAASFIDTPETVIFEGFHLQEYPVATSGIFSIDGTNFYPLGAGILGSVVSGQIEQFFCTAYTDATKVYLRTSNAFLSAKTVNVKLYFEALT